jgi:AraC-like DNA-binding protein
MPKLGVNGAPPTRTRLAVTNILAAVEQEGLSAEAALAASGLSRPPAQGMEERVPMEALYLLWEALVAQGASPMLAVRATLRARSTSRNLLRMLAGATSTLGSALQAAQDYWPLVTNAYGFSVKKGDHLRLVFDPVPLRPGARLDLLFTLAGFVNYARAWSRVELEPIRMHLIDAGPACPEGPWVSEMESCLTVEITIGSPVDEIVFPEGIESMPLRGHDEGMFLHLQSQADRILDDLTPAQTWSQRVRRDLSAVCRETIPQRVMAQRLGTSPRTLRRHLANEGTTFAALLDRWRAEEALALVAKQDDASLAATLGFSDERAFRRAFRRWTGNTPARLRRSELGPQGSRS